MIESTKEQVAEEQGEFKYGMRCIDQIFVLKQLVEKYREKKKEGRRSRMIKFAKDHCVGWCMDVDEYFIRCMSNLYNGSGACARLGSRVGEYFEVRKGLRHGCVMSL